MTEKDREQLLGYVLGALEPEEHAAVEARLADDRELRAEAAKLRSSLAPLDEDLPGYEPPAGLAGRACRLVAWTARKEAMARRRETGVAEWANSQPSWTLTDAAVAAGVLVAMSLLFFPALVRSGHNAAIARCQDNLRQVGVGYSRYAEMNAGLFPSVTPTSNLAFAGLSPARLLDQGYLENPKVLRCGSSDQVRTRAPAALYAQFELTMRDGEVRRLAARLVEIPDSYAFNVGYRSGEKYQGCRKIEKRCRQGIAGDAPRCHARGLPPENHEGRGGNLLFADGRVEFVATNGSIRQYYVSDAGIVEIPRNEFDDVLAGLTWRLTLSDLAQQQPR